MSLAKAPRFADVPAYSPGAKVLHWLVAGLVAAQFAVAWTMPDLHRGTPEGGWIDPHLSLGLLVLPGIIDIHGDAFERQMMPRPGVDFPIDVALFESDRQAIANGITTVFHGVTWSWEPGPPGFGNPRAML